MRKKCVNCAWRAFQGQWLTAFLDTMIVAGFSGAIWVARRRGRIVLVARSIALFVTIGLLAVAPTTGKLALFWAGPVILANLMLAGRKLGLGINLVLILGLLLLHQTPLTGLEQGTFVCTGLLISLYGYVFALTANQQQDKLEQLASYDDLTGAGDSGWAQWLDRADQALYAAKAAGRDQVQMAPAAGPVFPRVPRRRSEDQQAIRDADPATNKTVPAHATQLS